MQERKQSEELQENCGREKFLSLSLSALISLSEYYALFNQRPIWYRSDKDIAVVHLQSAEVRAERVIVLGPIPGSPTRTRCPHVSNNKLGVKDYFQVSAAVKDLNLEGEVN
jgi:hypothetical protein